MTVRQAVVLVPLPKAGVPVVLEPPEGFPVWAGCMPSPCPYEWREGEFVDVPGVIVMWEERSPYMPERIGGVSLDPVIFTPLTHDETNESPRSAASRSTNEPCQRPPAGWWCSRGALHDGPCAAWPAGEGPM